MRPQIHEPSSEASTFARCPDGFHLTGCGCYGADGGCAGAVLGADGESCGAVLQSLSATTLASLIANPQSLFHMRHGVFAQAHCLWEGGANELLVQTNNWDTERAACTPIADSDATMERERSAWLGQLANATGQRWAGHSWWQVRSPDLDGQLGAVGAALTKDQLEALIRTGQDQAGALKGRLPSDLPGSGSAHGVYSDDDNPVRQCAAAAATLTLLTPLTILTLRTLLTLLTLLTLPTLLTLLLHSLFTTLTRWTTCAASWTASSRT